MGAKFTSFDIKNFYTGIPLNKPQYVKIKLNNIHQEIIDKYDLWKKYQACLNIFQTHQ